MATLAIVVAFALMIYGMIMAGISTTSGNVPNSLFGIAAILVGGFLAISITMTDKRA